jgi:predicted ABC-type ATPase
MNNQPYLVVFAGANGAGKSSVIDILLKDTDIPYINPDIIAATEFDHIADQKEKYVCAMNTAEERRKACLYNNEPFAFETVLSKPDKIEFLNCCREQGYSVIGIYISTLNPDINRERIQGRVRQGGHDVPVDKIYSRYEESLKLMPELIKASDVCMVMDNSGKQLLYEFIKYNENHYVCKTSNKDMGDFVQKNIVRPLESAGISCQFLDMDKNENVVKIPDADSIRTSVEKSIRSRINKAVDKSSHNINNCAPKNKDIDR